MRFAGERGEGGSEPGLALLIARPASIVFTPELPKTRSGKIMRRLLCAVAEHRSLGDTSTLADPAVVEEIKTRAESDRGAEV